MGESTISRRDFLKLAGVGLIALGLGELEIKPRIEDEIPMSWRLTNALQVSNAIEKANASLDEKKIDEAAKLAFIWTFAESASMFGKKAGYEKSGKAMEHFLYGGGKKMDISSWFDEIKNNSDFWLSKVSNAWHTYDIERQKNPNYKRPSKDDYEEAFNKMAQRFKKGYTFISTANTDSYGDDWYFATGYSTFNLRSNVKLVTSDKGFILRLQNTTMDMTDNFDWDTTYPSEIPNKFAGFMQALANPLYQEFTKQSGILDNVLDEINLPEPKRTALRNSFDRAYAQYDSIVTDTTSILWKVEHSITKNDDILLETDLDILKKIGAQEYKISAFIDHPDDIVIEGKINDLDFMFYG